MKHCFINVVIVSDVEDLVYKNLLLKIEKRFEEINKFFNISSLSKPLYIRLWGNLEEFRKNEHEVYGRKKIASWLCGVARDLDGRFVIDTLVLSELNKCESHEKDSMQDLENLIVHEYIHQSIETISKDVCDWLHESLATFLSGQKGEKIEKFSYEDLENDKGLNYSTYYFVGQFIVENYTSVQINRLLNDKTFLKQESSKIYNGVISESNF